MTEYKKYEVVCEALLLSEDYNENLLPGRYIIAFYISTQAYNPLFVL